MKMTSKSLLCRENWYWDSNKESYIRFNEDGTGQLVARRELSIFIAACFTWEAQSPGRLSNVIDIGLERRPNTGLLDVLDVKVELSKLRVQEAARIDIDRYKINECLLQEAAFSSSRHTVRLEKGTFMTVDDTMVARELPFNCYYSYRLLFEPSPFPPRHLWKEKAVRALEKLQFWEWRQFVAGKLPLEKKECSAQG
ncbi:hypothetical protein N7492_007495 [Penicillium capsulatum]|uniref:Uncharacterized protein n=1 Tax=Penicillium capsulatum TaxID=69766 RepID=A0A9W9I252_9EURO|nr:hypothetical protein N7492_007495 [Penicillium capsulatum]KAJ6117329.1 hypothetical protein N7512_007054 [Penicillium capsulatum]